MSAILLLLAGCGPDRSLPIAESHDARGERSLDLDVVRALTLGPTESTTLTFDVDASRMVDLVVTSDSLDGEVSLSSPEVDVRTSFRIGEMAGHPFPIYVPHGTYQIEVNLWGEPDDPDAAVQVGVHTLDDDHGDMNRPTRAQESRYYQASLEHEDDIDVFTWTLDSKPYESGPRHFSFAKSSVSCGRVDLIAQSQTGTAQTLVSRMQAGGGNHEISNISRWRITAVVHTVPGQEPCTYDLRLYELGEPHRLDPEWGREQLLISELVHAEGRFGFVEIVNQGMADVDLGDYYLTTHLNGSADSDLLSTLGESILAPGDAHTVLMRGSADALSTYEDIYGLEPAFVYGGEFDLFYGTDAISLINARTRYQQDRFGVPDEDGAFNTWGYRNSAVHRDLGAKPSQTFRRNEWREVQPSAFDNGAPEAELANIVRCTTPGDASSVVPEVCFSGDLEASLPVSPVWVHISEVMADPAAVADRSGEWFEIHNPSPSAIELEGAVFSDLDNDSFTVDFPLIIEPEGTLVFARDADPVSNGGVDVDVVLPASFQLSNSSDELVVTMNGVEHHRVEWDGSFPMESGVAMQVLDPQGDASDSVAWTAACASYGAGDSGSPGSLNPTCE